MINSEGFTILEFLLVSVMAAALLTAAMPLFQDLQYLMIKQTQLSQLFIRAQLGYSILRQAVNTAGSMSCLNGRRPAALQVVERSIIHDKTVSDDNNVLMVNGCKIYNSQPHWLQSAYFIARSSVAAVPALYSKIIAIDKMPVSLPKVEEIAGVNSLHFFGCVFVDSRWRCNTTLLSATVVAVAIKLQSSRATRYLLSNVQEQQDLPLFTDKNSFINFRASWDFSPEVQ